MSTYWVPSTIILSVATHLLAPSLGTGEIISSISRMQESRKGFWGSHVWVTGMPSISHCSLAFRAVCFPCTELPLCWRTYVAVKAEGRGLRHRNIGPRLMTCGSQYHEEAKHPTNKTPDLVTSLPPTVAVSRKFSLWTNTLDLCSCRGKSVSICTSPFFTWCWHLTVEHLSKLTKQLWNDTIS